MGYFDNRGPTAGTCEQCGKEFKSLYGHWSRNKNCENPDQIPYSRFALFSGGHDSLVSTHYCMVKDLTDCVLHLDTNTGVGANQDFVKRVCEEYDWPLEIYTARMEWDEFAKEFVFPKAGAHNWAYRYFKLMPLQRAARDSCESHQEMYTGVRRDESSRRMSTVEDEKDEQTWTWYAPIADWTDEDCDEYREKHNLPSNPVVKDIHRSGECYCGAYAHRDEELIDLSANYPEHAEWILETEKDVQNEIGTDDDYCWWGSEGVSSERLQELSDGENEIPMMCKQCGVKIEEYSTVGTEK